MIYQAAKHVLLAVMKAPGQPPKSPAGRAGSVQVFRASRQYLVYQLAVLGLLCFFLLTVLGVFGLAAALSQTAPTGAVIAVSVLALVVVLLGSLGYFLIRLEYDMRYYVVTDRSLRIRKGVLTITEVTLTFANVQHLEIRQGPIQRLLGISNLIVRTAGGAGPVNPQQPGQGRGHRGVMEGIDNAAEIRDLINGHLKHHRHTGLGDPEDLRRKQPAAAGLSPEALARLREVRDELRAWRQGTTSIRPG